MEAKVDIRKLQVLSDRINQATEALNQVRASVHGLGHTSAVSPYGYGLGAQSQLGSLGLGGFAQGQSSPFQSSPFMMGMIPGMQHSTGIGQSQLGIPQISGIPFGYGAQSSMIPGIQGQISPWTVGQVGGLQHSMTTQLPFSQQAYGQQSFAQQPYGNQGFYGAQQSNVGVPYGLGSQVNPFGYGLQHSSAMQQSPWTGMSQVQSQIPGLQSSIGLAPEFVEQRVLEARASDPYRLAQTFPFAFSSQAPVGIW